MKAVPVYLPLRLTTYSTVLKREIRMQNRQEDDALDDI